jgi:hypothetical protein
LPGLGMFSVYAGFGLGRFSVYSGFVLDRFHCISKLNPQYQYYSVHKKNILYPPFHQVKSLTSLTIRWSILSIIIISSKCNLFWSWLWYSCKIAHFDVKHQSLIHSLKRFPIMNGPTDSEGSQRFNLMKRGI